MTPLARTRISPAPPPLDTTTPPVMTVRRTMPSSGISLQPIPPQSRRGCTRPAMKRTRIRIPLLAMEPSDPCSITETCMSTIIGDATVSQQLGSWNFIQGGDEWVQDEYQGLNRLVGNDRGQQITTNDVWLQDRVQPWKRLSLTVGGRYNHHSLYGSHV